MPGKHRNRPAWLKWGALIVWMGLIFFLSNQPTLPGPHNGWLDLILKKSAHAAAYAVLMILWHQALQTLGLRGAKNLIVALFLTLLYAISDEWHQTFIPGRHGQLADVLVDLSGALLALILIRRFNRKSKIVNPKS